MRKTRQYQTNEDVPTSSEIYEPLKMLKNNKCKGIDDIVSEALKYGRNSTGLISEMVKIFKHVWEH